jgi:DNA-binding NarL/FixJ family response regulator
VPVVGRDAPLADLNAFVQRIPHAGGAVVVEGEAGIGKTTVWQYAVDSALAAGYLVLATCGAAAETAFGYGGLAELLSGLDAPFDSLPDPQRDALGAALLQTRPRRAPDPRAVFAAFTSVVRALAAHRPVLVAVDDRQWLDTSSRKALDFLARRVASEAIGVLAAQRPEVDHPPNAQVLRLGPLTTATLHTLIKNRLGVSLPRTTILRLHDIVNGNPFFALEVAQALVEAGGPGSADSWPVPADLRDLIAARVDRVAPTLRRKLLRAAADGSQLVDGLTPGELRAAERAGIVVAGRRGGTAFAHPLYASAIYTRVTPDERQRIHRELAAASGDIESRARHLALAADAPDDAVAALLDEAATSARGRGAPDVAAELAARAAALSSDPGGTWSRRLVSAEHRFHAGDFEQARNEARALVAEAPRGPPRSRARLVYAEAVYRLGDVGGAVSELRAAVDDAEGDLRSTAAAEIELAFVLNQSFTSFAEAIAAVDRAVEAAEALADPSVLGAALAMSAAARFIAGRGVDATFLARALALEDVDADVPVERRPSFAAAACFAYTESFDRARELLTGLATMLEARGEETQLPLVLTYLSFVECRSGHAARAAELAEQALSLSSTVGSENDVAFAKAMRAFVAAHAGIEATAREAAQAAAASGLAFASFIACVALAHLELSLGDARAALESIRSSLEIAEAEDVVEPGRWPHLADALEALVEVGELERAERLTEMLERNGKRLQRPGAIACAVRARALVLAARGQVADAVRVLDASPQSPVPLEQARLLLARGRLERRRKQKRAARLSLEQALDLFDEIGARRWAERTRAELSRIKGRDAGELTVTELRIAQLAASGLTNREIATTAFVSQKTVEANLSRIYRKLGIRSRAELGLTLARRPGEHGPESGG